MWLFTQDGFFSFGVCREADTDWIEVRARCREDIERLRAACPSLAATHEDEGPIGGSDYRFKARVRREDIVKYAADCLRRVDYSDFKRTVDEKRRQPLRTKAYVSCWHALFLWQEGVFTETKKH